MPIVNVNLVLDDATYAAVKMGTLELCGMVKDHEHKVRKHLPAVWDATKEGAAKAIDTVRAHKKGFIIVGGLAVLGGATAGAISYFTKKDKRLAKKQLGEALKIYLSTTQEGTLTIEIIDQLIAALDTIETFYKNKQIPLNLTPKQLNTLIASIFDFTSRMAQTTGLSHPSILPPKIWSKKTIFDLQPYLRAQKHILTHAS